MITFEMLKAEIARPGEYTGCELTPEHLERYVNALVSYVAQTPSDEYLPRNGAGLCLYVSYVDALFDSRYNTGKLCTSYDIWYALDALQCPVVENWEACRYKHSSGRTSERIQLAVDLAEQLRDMLAAYC